MDCRVPCLLDTLTLSSALAILSLSSPVLSIRALTSWRMGLSARRCLTCPLFLRFARINGRFFALSSLSQNVWFVTNSKHSKLAGKRSSSLQNRASDFRTLCVVSLERRLRKIPRLHLDGKEGAARTLHEDIFVVFADDRAHLFFVRNEQRGVYGCVTILILEPKTDIVSWIPFIQIFRRGFHDRPFHAYSLYGEGINGLQAWYVQSDRRCNWRFMTCNF